MQRRECLQALFALVAAAGMPGLAGAGEPTAMHRVRDLQRGAWLTGDELLARLVGAPALAIGERHDNPEHHRLERWLLARLAERDALGGVAVEVLSAGSQETRARDAGTRLAELPAAELQEALGWQQGWAWSAYGPMLRQVLRLDVPLRGANLPRERIGEIVAANRAPALPVPVARAQRRALIEGHCGLLPESMLDGMLAAQAARDKAMAATLDGLLPTAVLICGSGHARRDIGVALHADRTPLCLGLVELAPGGDWRSALPESVDDGPPFDLAWFTPPVAGRGDPCAALRERFSR